MPKTVPSREKAHRCLGQCLPLYPPFGASWQMGIRPCITFPSPPLKFRTAGFPQYGFKPVVINGNLHPSRGLYAAQASPVPIHSSPEGKRRTVSALRWNPSQRTGPEALGSASGFIVPSRHRLLWPHPRFWILPAAYCSSSAGSVPRRPEPRRSLI